MQAPAPQSAQRRVRRPRLSETQHRVLWGVLGALGGAFIASETQARLSPLVVGLGLVIGSALGALMGKTATKMMPLLGIVIGPFIAIALMNVQRFNASNVTTLAPVRRGPATSANVGFPMSSVAMGVGALGSAVVAAILLTALSRRLMGRRPLRRSMRGVGWIGFWVTLLMIGISYFAPV
jgi:hypothetical protein